MTGQRRTITVSYDPDDLPIGAGCGWVSDFERELVSDDARRGKSWGIPIRVETTGPTPAP